MQRTYKQRGQGYGRKETTVVVKLDDQEIYNGPIPTFNMIMPVRSNTGGPFTGSDLWTWIGDAKFRGSQCYEITVADGNLLLTQTVANHVYPWDPDRFDAVFRHQIDAETIMKEPLSDVTIDGVTYDRDVTSDLLGQHFWRIYDGQTFRATLNISGWLTNKQDASIL